jgi:ankyrin repeat protein
MQAHLHNTHDHHAVPSGTHAREQELIAAVTHSLKSEFEKLNDTLASNHKMLFQLLRTELSKGRSETTSSAKTGGPLFRDDFPESVDGPSMPLRPSPHPPIVQNQEKALPLAYDDELTVDDVVEIPDVGTFQEACSNGTQEEVVALLEKRADPNTHFTNCKCKGTPVEFVTGSPLALATIRGDEQLVAELLKFEANVNSEYSFLAGVEQLEWKGTAIHACVKSGNVPLMEQLLFAKADLEARGSNGASLLWNAAFFGKDSVVDLLIMNGLDLEMKASSQDDVTVEFTPLHVAARAGHATIVDRLLDARAKVDGYAEQDRRPVEDAIKEAHPAVVKKLVQASANLFEQSCFNPYRTCGIPGADRLSRREARGPFRQRIIDDLLDTPNMAVVSAAAEGLSDAGHLLYQMTEMDFIRFLGCAGNTPILIMKAVFQPVRIEYWELKDGKKHRVRVTSTKINSHLDMNTAFGPQASTLKNLYSTKEVLAGKYLTFLHTIAPKQPPQRWFDAAYLDAQADFYCCPLHFGRHPLCVLVALTEFPDADDIFRMRETQSLVELQWTMTSPYARCLLFIALVELGNLLQMLLSLRGGDEPFLSVLLAALVWILGVVLQVVQIAGFIASGLQNRAFFTFVKTFERVVLMLTGVVIFFTWSQKLKVMDSPGFRVSLGILVYFKWTNVLIQCRQIKAVAIRILPITSTMTEVGPFVAVLSVYWLASANMYYAFGNDGLKDTFLQMYRSTVLGDAALLAPENYVDSAMQVPTQLMTLFASFVIGVTMMNIFIAVLGEAYSAAHESAEGAFLRSRAGIVLDIHAARTGFKCCRALFARRRRGIVDLDAEDDLHVWFGVPKQDN